MADLTDVENAIVSLIDAALYPTGDGNPSATGDTIKIYPGWPNAAQLDADVAAKVVNISVFPLPGVERNTTRYRREPKTLTSPVHTLSATVSGNAVTIGGTVSTPQNIVVLCGSRFVFPYGVQSEDTLASIAAALAVLIAAVFPGTSASGPTINIVGEPSIVQARVGGAGTTWTELRRQNKGFDVSIWASSPTQRAAVAKVVDIALAQIDWLTLADQSAARMILESSIDFDEAQKVTIYRRCFRLMIEYPTSVTKTDYEIGVVEVTVTGGVSPDGSADNVDGAAVETSF